MLSTKDMSAGSGRVKPVMGAGNNVIKINTAWRTDEDDDIAVHMYKGDIKFRTYPLGLCPEEAYKSMIENHIKNLNNEEFWKEQNKQDLFIHTVLENAI